MRDPLDVRSTGALDVACQIVRMEPLAHGTVVDLVTLEPCERGPAHLPAGTPVTLGFASEPTDEVRANIESAMTLWEIACTPLQLRIGAAPEGLRYHFTGADRFLTLVVEDQPG